MFISQRLIIFICFLLTVIQFSAVSSLDKKLIEKCNGLEHILVYKHNLLEIDNPKMEARNFTKSMINRILTEINDYRDNYAKKKSIPNMIQVEWHSEIVNMAQADCERNPRNFGDLCYATKSFDKLVIFRYSVEGSILKESVLIENGLVHFRNYSQDGEKIITSPNFNYMGCTTGRPANKDHYNSNMICLVYLKTNIVPEKGDSCSKCDSVNSECNTLAYENLCGFSGLRGETGIKGEKGDVGDKGSIGDSGVEGDVGPIGLTGYKGAAGEKGDRGLRGEKGVVGLKGDTGRKGDQGEQGFQGERGPRGIQGKKGDPGVLGPIGLIEPKEGKIFYKDWTFWTVYGMLTFGLILNVTILLVKKARNKNSQETPIVGDETVDQHVWVRPDSLPMEIIQRKESFAYTNNIEHTDDDIGTEIPLGEL